MQLREALTSAVAFEVAPDKPAHTGTATVTIKLEWEYESGDDELDTQYGTNAYQFITENPDTPCVHLEIELGAKQINS